MWGYCSGCPKLIEWQSIFTGISSDILYTPCHYPGHCNCPGISQGIRARSEPWVHYYKYKLFSVIQWTANPYLESAKNTVQQTRVVILAGVGVIILFWSVISLLDQIETSFNHIWQISSSRQWFRKFTDYLQSCLLPRFCLYCQAA